MLATKEKGDDQGQQTHYNLSRLIVTTSSGTIQKASTWELWEVNNSREIGEERQTQELLVWCEFLKFFHFYLPR